MTMGRCWRWMFKPLLCCSFLVIYWLYGTASTPPSGTNARVMSNMPTPLPAATSGMVDHYRSGQDTNLPRRVPPEQILLHVPVARAPNLQAPDTPRHGHLLLPDGAAKRTPDSPYIRAIASAASHHGDILLALVDVGFIPMVVNFFTTSIKPYGITNYLILSLHPGICPQLQQYGINCFLYRNHSRAGATSQFGSKDFMDKMNVRTDMILEALNAGFRVLHSDVDMLFFKDPFQERPCRPDNCDMAILYDSIVYNAGFLFINPTNASKQVYKAMQRMAQKKPALDDQKQLNLVIKQMRKYTNITKLPTAQFQCGLEYYEKPKRYFAETMAPCPQCIVVHNNWIVSMAAKVYRAKELQQWVYDVGGYFTSTETKYLAYQNPLPAAKTSEEIEALKSALRIASVLNRTLILPRFHMERVEVPLNALLRITVFDAHFQYRESSFLTHPLVPDAVKLSTFATPLIMSSFVNSHFSPSLLKDIQLVPVEPVDKKHGMSEQAILSKFGSLTQSVLKFHSMYDAFSAFSDDEQNRIWQKKFQNGLTLAGYRQY